MKMIMNKINRRFESDARTIRGIIVRSAVTAPASCWGIKALLKRSSVCSCSAGFWHPFGFQRCAFVSCVFMRDQLQMCKQASEMSDDVAVLRSRRHAALTPNHDMQWRFHFFSHLLLLWIHVPSVSQDVFFRSVGIARFLHGTFWVLFCVFYSLCYSAILTINPFCEIWSAAE